MDPNQLEQPTEQFMTEQLLVAIDEAATESYRHLTQHIPKRLRRHRREKGGFEKRLLKRWAAPLELLEAFYLFALDQGSAFNEEESKTRLEDDWVFEAVRRLHAKACLVTSEVLVLLKAGHAGGAYTRWRTLHEVTVVADFIAERGQSVAKRYIQHNAQKSYEDAQAFQKHCAGLGQEPISEEEFQEIQQTRDELTTEYGSGYEGGYGWASESLRKSNPSLIGKKIGFKEIEEAVGVSHMRPHYRLASHSIHPSSKSVAFEVGLLRQDVLLSGPSNAGLSDPGQNTAIALHLSTVTFLNLNPTAERLLSLKTLALLVEDIKVKFAKAEAQLESDEFS